MRCYDVCCVLQVMVGRLSVDVGTLRYYDRQLHMLYVKALVPFTVAAIIFFVVVAVCVYRRHKERLCKYVHCMMFCGVLC